MSLPAPSGLNATVRDADPRDVPDLLRLVRELAAYEREPEAAVATEGDFLAALFPAEGAPVAHAHVAELGVGAERRVVGMALWFTTFSTWTGKPGVWLEDLYVEERHRGAGLGGALLATVAAECVRLGYPRLEWTVLDWNAPSIAFYRSVGAVGMEEWTTQRVTGDALAALAAKGRRKA